MKKTSFTPKKQSFMIFLILFSSTLNFTFQDVYNKYCTRASIPAPLSQTLLISNRNAEIGLSAKISDITNIVNDGNTAPLFKGAGAYVIVLIIMAIFVLFSFLFFLCFCCCCDRVKNPNDGTSKICITLASFLLLVVVALYITNLVFIGKLQSNLESAVCSIARVPVDLLQGVNYNPNTFIGLNSLLTVMKTFSNDLPSMGSISSNLMNIFNRNLPSYTSPAIQSLASFASTYANTTTSNGNGIQAVPISVSSLTPFTNQAIQDEFNAYDTLANQLHNACLAGWNLALTSPGGIDTSAYRTALSIFGGQIENMINTITNSLGPATVVFNFGVMYTPIGYWIMFGLLLLAGLFTIAMIILISCMAENKNDNCRCGTKCCLLLITLITFILALAAILLLLCTIVVATGCQNIPTILNSKSSTIVSTVNNWGINLDSSSAILLSTCLASDSTGNITNLFPSASNTIINTPLTFLDGIVAFNSIKSSLSSSNFISPTITTLVNLWSNYQTSIISDQPNAVSALASLNQAVTCGGVSYQLNSLNCSTTTNCFGIYNSQSPTVPSCAPPTTTQIYINLQQFTLDEFNLLSGMIINLNSTNSNSPNSLQMQYKMQFVQVIPDYNTIINAIGKFLQFMPSTTGGLFNSTNCTVVQNELLNIENAVCFQFNNSLYYFTVLLIFSVFFFFFISWCLCCSLLFVGERVETIGVIYANVKNEAIPYDEIDQNPIY